MPTAAKLIAGLLLAGLAYLVSEIIKTLLPDSTAFGMFSEINAGIAFICGWVVVGNRAGRGAAAAVSNGLTGVAAMIFWCLGAHAVNEMIERSLDRRYDSMIEAFTAVFELMAEYGLLLFEPRILAALLFGSLVVGYMSEVASRHWR